jgi:hypothetical protein
MNFLRLISIASLFALMSLTVGAQRQSSLVSPQATDPEISTNLNNHYVSINRGVAPKNLLFVFLPGTGGVAALQMEVNNTAADLGFHAINLTYPNDDAVNSLCGGLSVNLDCYGNVRLETKDGTDRSALVNVNRANSIENRLIKLLQFLQNRSPQDNWAQFMVGGTSLNWPKIVVSGHSQGGGHAGIIGRYHPVARVVMFAAMDFNGLANAPANWIALPQTTPNATPPERFWGFSHTRDDMINFSTLTTRIWPAYGMPAFGAVVNTDGASPPYSNSHSLTTDMNCDNTHGCVVVDARLVRVGGVPVVKPVWEYLLSGLLAVNISGVRFSRAERVVGQIPTGVSSKSYRLLIDGANFAPGMRAVVNGTDVETEFVTANLVRVRLPAGPTRPPGRSTVAVDGATFGF